MVVFVAIVSLLYLTSTNAVPRQKDKAESRQGVSLDDDHSNLLSLIITGLNKEFEDLHHTKSNKLINYFPPPTPSMIEKNTESDYENDHVEEQGDTCDLLDINNQEVHTTVQNYQNPSFLRMSEEVLACENNCNRMIATRCHSCVETTIQALSFSCKKQCHSQGNSPYLNEYLQPKQELCKRKEPKCCRNNCNNKVLKLCFVKGLKICMRDTVDILKSVCVSKCETTWHMPATQTWKQDYSEEIKKETSPIYVQHDSVAKIITNSQPNPKSEGNFFYKSKNYSDNRQNIIQEILSRYLAKQSKDVSRNCHHKKKIVVLPNPECQQECKEEIRSMCYGCTEFTIETLSGSCYSKCNANFKNSNPYRELLFAEKFRTKKLEE